MRESRSQERGVFRTNKWLRMIVLLIGDLLKLAGRFLRSAAVWLSLPFLIAFVCRAFFIKANAGNALSNECACDIFFTVLFLEWWFVLVDIKRWLHTYYESLCKRI